jgi:hypothetical protein
VRVKFGQRADDVSKLLCRALSPWMVSPID